MPASPNEPHLAWLVACRLILVSIDGHRLGLDLSESSSEKEEEEPWLGQAITLSEVQLCPPRRNLQINS